MTIPVQASQPRPDVPDTGDMVVVHKMFRRELGLLPQLVTRVPDGDVARARQVIDHARLVIAFLENHHEGEDELLWPLLVQRTHVDQALVWRMTEQHELLHDALLRTEGALQAWGRWPGADERTGLVAELEPLHDVLTRHLDEEERNILPLVERHLTTQEWGRLAEHGRAATPASKARALMLLGAILEDAHPVEQARFLATVPSPARMAWRAVGRHVYRHYTRRIRGAA